MELRQLEYFVAVAQEENFTRAAERVQISQSGVSAQIKALEAELGTALFDRSSRTARLTEAGAAALRHAHDALDAANGLRQAVDEVRGVVRGRLTVGMVTGCEVTPLFDALAAFRRAHPGIELALREDNSDELVAGVRAGGIDIALVGVAGAVPDGLAAHTIVSEGLAALVTPGHPLAGRQRVPLSELSTYDLVTLPRGTGVRGVLDGGDRPINVALEASAPGAVVDLAARGLGVAVLSRSMAAAYGGMQVVLIDGLDLPAILALVWRPRTGPALRALLPHCRTAFTPENPQAMPTAAATTPDR